MTTYIYTEPSLRNQQVNLLAASRAPVQGHIVELLSSLVNNDSAAPGTTLNDVLNSLYAARLYDHVVRSLADLPTPVGTNINLTSGSYAFPVALNLGGNTLNIATGVNVLLDGLGVGNTLSSTIAVVTMAAGGSNSLYGRNLRLSSAGGHTLAIGGGNVSLVSSQLVCTGVRGAISVSGTHTTELVNCDLSHDGTGYCISCSGNAGWVKQIGGRWFNSAGTGAGLFLNGNMTLGFQLIGVNTTAAFTDCIQYSSGTIRSGHVSGCRFTGTNGITWAAANLPTMGLAIVGNAFDLATPFNGFTSASARANLKANMGAAGLLSETAIVP